MFYIEEIINFVSDKNFNKKFDKNEYFSISYLEYRINCKTNYAKCL